MLSLSLAHPYLLISSAHRCDFSVLLPSKSKKKSIGAVAHFDAEAGGCLGKCCCSPARSVHRAGHRVEMLRASEVPISLALKGNQKMQEHYHSQPGYSSLEIHLFCGSWGKVLESPNSYDICLLTKARISVALTRGSCFHIFSFSPKARRVRTFWLFAKEMLWLRCHQRSLGIRILHTSLLYYYF